MHRHTALFRWSQILCLSAALWFALGGAIKVFAAHSTSKTIEIAVCSGAGIKKIYAPLQSSSQADHEVSLKHCSNAPLALATAPWNALAFLRYAMPSQAGRWQATQSIDFKRDWQSNGLPPPGRAPPLLS